MPPRVISMLLIGQLLVVFFGVMVIGILLRIADAESMVATEAHLEKSLLHHFRDYGF